MNGFRFISRLVREAADRIYMTLNDRTVRVYFQTSPAWPTGDPRGIEHLQYRVRATGVELGGTTETDGQVSVPIRGGRPTTLELLHNGNPVATYEVTATSLSLDPVGGIEGQKQRLRLLGYHIGHDGIHNNGVDTVDNQNFRGSVLDFQSDQRINHSGGADADTQNWMTNEVGS